MWFQFFFLCLFIQIYKRIWTKRIYINLRWNFIFHMGLAHVNYAYTKVTYFFDFLEKFTFLTISSKIAWVSKIGVFFFGAWKKIQRFETSEWVKFKIFQEKNTKKKNTELGKKIQRKMGLKIAFLKKYSFPLIYFKLLQTSWVSGMKTFSGKKIQRVSGRYFFFWNCVGEWPQTFPRK